MVRSTIPTNREAVRSPEIVFVSLKNICLFVAFSSPEHEHIFAIAQPFASQAGIRKAPSWEQSASGPLSHCSLAQQVSQLAFKLLNYLLRPLNGCREFATLLLPAVNAFNLLFAAPLFGFELVADPTLLLELRSGHDKFGAACFTCAVFSVAMLPEMAPFVIAAGESMLVVKAHPGTSFSASEVLLKKETES